MPQLAPSEAKIAIIKVGALGDVVRTTSLLLGLKRLFPSMELTWITGPEAVSLVEGNPHVAHTVTLDGSADETWRNVKYDWIVSLDDEERLCRLATSLSSKRLSGAYWDGSGRAYTEDLAPWFGMGLLRPASQGGLARANELKRDNCESYGEILYRCLGLPKPLQRPFVPITADKRQRAAD